MKVSPSDILDAESEWNRRRVELTNKIIAAAGELIAHSGGACKITILRDGMEVVITLANCIETRQ